MRSKASSQRPVFSSEPKVTQTQPQHQSHHFRSQGTSSPPEAASPDYERFAKPVLGAIVGLSVFLAATRASLSHQSWMVFFEDDLYYYLKIAQHLAHGAGSTFNGLVSTNGYHPLWLLLLAGLSVFSTNGHVIFAFLVFMTLVATTSVFLLASEILKQASVRPLLRSALAAYVSIYTLHLCYTGMEIILAIPLMFLLIVVAGKRTFWQRGLGPSFLLGLLVSTMILARLDLALLAALLLFWTAVNPTVRKSISAPQIAGLALGLVPLAIYFLLNHFYFGTWMPISGMAKQLKFTHMPSLRPWLSVYTPNVSNALNLLPVHLALLGLPFLWTRLSSTQKVIFPSVLLFPFLYLFLLSCVSDWILWNWYLYPMRAALCVSFVVLALFPPVHRILQMPLLQWAVVLIVCGQAANAKWWTDVQPPIYAAAVDLKQFAQTHPGIYAMGDRSGMVAYLIADPVVQTEGLVMDRAFLEHIRHQDPLLKTLADYHVRYYVGTAVAPFQGCFHAREPFQAGATSARMVGDFCQTPLASFTHENYQTMVFDLDKERAQ